MMITNLQSVNAYIMCSTSSQTVIFQLDHLILSYLEQFQYSIVMNKYYATQVTYHVEGFLDKNKDKLFKDLSQAMFACERGMLKKLFPEGDPDAAHLKRPSTTGHQFKVSRSHTDSLANSINHSISISHLHLLNQLIIQSLTHSSITIVIKHKFYRVQYVI